MIILLSAGEHSKDEPSTVVNQTIIAGKQLAGSVVVLAFGLDTGQKTCNFHFSKSNVVSLSFAFLINLYVL